MATRREPEHPFERLSNFRDAGGPNTLVDAIKCVRKSGTVVFASGGIIANFPAVDMNAKRVTLKAARGHSYQAVETAIELISSGLYPVELMATHEFKLDEVDLAIRSIGGQGCEGKRTHQTARGHY